MLLGTLGATLLRNMLAIKRAMSTRACKQTIGASKGTVRNSQDQSGSPSYPLTKFEIQKHYREKPKCNSVFW